MCCLCGGGHILVLVSELNIVNTVFDFCILYFVSHTFVY